MKENMERRFLCDRNGIDDNARIFNGGSAVIRNGLGETLFTVNQTAEEMNIHNKVIIPGSITTACKHFKIAKPALKLPNYNTVLGLENNEAITSVLDNYVVLFAMGNDGTLDEGSQVIDIDYTKWIQPENLIPFKCKPLTGDLSSADRNVYFGRKVSTDYKYYFKAFDTAPELITQRVDGTPIDENIYSSTSTMQAETFVKLNLTVTKTDFREFFIARDGNLNEAKVSSLSLLTAQPKLVGGYTYYMDIQPLTKLAFPTELLIDETKGLQITYCVYY